MLIGFFLVFFANAKDGFGKMERMFSERCNRTTTDSGRNEKCSSYTKRYVLCIPTITVPGTVQSIRKDFWLEGFYSILMDLTFTIKNHPLGGINDLFFGTHEISCFSSNALLVLRMENESRTILKTL